MPTFGTPRKGVSVSDAAKEAAAIAPKRRPMLHTFELYQPLGTPDGPIYIVNDLQNFTATKEVDADRDAGLEVTFLAMSLVDGPPEESDAASAPQLTLTAGNVSGLISDMLRAMRGSIVPLEVIERVYAADDPSGPAQDPVMNLIASNVDIDQETAALTASFGDPGTVSVPRTTIKRIYYPGLVR